MELCGHSFHVSKILCNIFTEVLHFCINYHCNMTCYYKISDISLKLQKGGRGGEEGVEVEGDLNLTEYFLYLNGLQCKPLQLRKILLSTFLYLNSLQWKPLQLRKILFSTFLYLNGLHCKPLQLRKILFSTFLLVERFAVQTVAIKKILFSVFFLYLNGLQCKPLTITEMLSAFRFCA